MLSITATVQNSIFRTGYHENSTVTSTMYANAAPRYAVETVGNIREYNRASKRMYQRADSTQEEKGEREQTCLPSI